MWYNYQDIKDAEERMLDARDMLEYHASFIEPGVVSKVLENRKSNAQNNGIVAGTTSDTEFNESVKRLFGRDPGIAAPSDADEVHKLDGVIDRINEYHEKQAALKQTSTPYNYGYWTDVELG